MEVGREFFLRGGGGLVCNLLFLGCWWGLVLWGWGGGCCSEFVCGWVVIVGEVVEYFLR